MQPSRYPNPDRRRRTLGRARAVTLALAGGSLVAVGAIADIAAHTATTVASAPTSGSSPSSATSSTTSSSSSSSSSSTYTPPVASSSAANVSSGAS